MDDIPLIFDPLSGRYHRISRSGERLLPLLDGSRARDDLVQSVSAATADSARLQESVNSFLDSLASSGLLVGSSPDTDGDSRVRRFQTTQLMPRFVVSRALPTLLEPLAAVIRGGPQRLIAVLSGLGAVFGYLTAIGVLVGTAPPLEQMIGPALLVACGLMIAQTLVHESCHALVAQVCRVPVRGLGVALLFYFMPLAYVDRTDAYRLQRRGPRVLLALAGPMADGWIAGTTALVAFLGTGFVSDVATALLLLQVIGLVINLNPLLPSDGYAAIEAGTGLVDARGRAFTILANTVTRRPLPRHLQGVSLRARAAHLAYATCCLLYVGMIAVAMLNFFALAVSLVEGRFHS
ncbi:PqqD family peptide modification chaperone [Spiractinospora alimapuensis]|uniref:PqqD family peptide modification chaperone n=1 Tax=Spiractinospora alimapuensis TaxID=2820884 RepID=UPI001F4551C7|nr:PqqD family peptide modification chaperone [Spiractinospora alimapuensis]QVQ50245.1 PqqD family peptide modification chaperone [Spiractinospora alimapuensis]